MTKPLWQATPLVQSNNLPLQLPVYLKFENHHPSYSFKYRGISHFIQNARDKQGPSAHFVIASGGNAGLAAACATHRLDARCTIFLPEGASPAILEVLKREKANVVIFGNCYASALREAERVASTDNNAIMVPAYDDPLVWEGHSSMVKEISEQMCDKPAAICCSVGGAGLLGGIIIGCKSVGWDDVPIIAVETIGSNCFYSSINLNRARNTGTEVSLPSNFDSTPVYDEANDVYLARQRQFTSAASGSLGASTPAAAVVRMALDRKGGIICVNIPDAMSMQTAVRFAENQKILVELSCATSLSLGYKTSLLTKLLPAIQGPVVFIVCGGFKISLDEVMKYRQDVEKEIEAGVSHWEVYADGKLVLVDKEE